MKAAILLSRQALRPRGTTPWVRSSREAVEWVSNNGGSIVTSIGMQTWELTLALASIHGLPVTVVVPLKHEGHAGSAIEHTQKQFNLSEKNSTFVPIVEPDSRLRMTKRDKTVIEIADTLVPVSLREGSTIGQRLANASATKNVITDFTIPHEKTVEPIHYDLKDTDLTDDIKSIGADYIIHWTRAANGPWPTEPAIEYYRYLVHSDSYPRDAFATLKRILSTKTIAASTRHMPGNIPTVSFSARPPADFIPLMRWRARYREMSFEPFGVGVRKETATAVGIRPVAYGRSTASAEPWLCQSLGKHTNWSHEEEFRYTGDFDFSQINPRDLICFCHSQAQAAMLAEMREGRVVPFTFSPNSDRSYF